jgi:hypothetical protein
MRAKPTIKVMITTDKKTTRPGQYSANIRVEQVTWVNWHFCWRASIQNAIFNCNLDYFIFLGLTIEILLAHYKNKLINKISGVDFLCFVS